MCVCVRSNPVPKQSAARPSLKATTSSLPKEDLTQIIADKLGISRGASKMRVERGYQKLGVHSRAEATQRVPELRVVP